MRCKLVAKRRDEPRRKFVRCVVLVSPVCINLYFRLSSRCVAVLKEDYQCSVCAGRSCIVDTVLAGYIPS
jgi:hypothetical protein